MARHPKNAPIGKRWMLVLRAVEKAMLLTTEGVAESLYPAATDDRPRDPLSRSINPPDGRIFPSMAAMAQARGVLELMRKRGYVREAKPWRVDKLWAVGEEGALVLAEVRNRPRRRYKTDPVRRIKAKHRRDELREQNHCINGSSHGLATHGCRCEPCHETHRRSA